MTRERKLTDDEFLKLIINKELEIAGADITYDDIVEDGKLPNEERKLSNWHDMYSFDTIDQYIEWKNFVLDHFNKWKSGRLSKRYMEEWFSWNSLCYGLRYNFDYQELINLNNKQKKEKKND